ncbi:MAG TPA: NADH-ubiquinone oxidoreductase-F iron-sulfur binding region domain-containing protein [Candidatus Polarisedimenticolia bacterium]|nr:NADH-ubiquinone oxidoreductase-F iron-sulfur binding region domain-containing protein [Candidatus Polarisedimenticolia bacterium]
MTPALLTAIPPGKPYEDLASYAASGGYRALGDALSGSGPSPAGVLRLVEEAGLRGRGGAAFPAARKWALAAAAGGSPKHVVANGGEHEPGSLKDRLLVARHPHKVIEGMALCAYATGASEGWLYLIEDMSEAVERAEEAAREARAAGLLGPARQDGGFRFEVRVVKAPPTYVAGEETAALEVIEGRKPWPRRKPPFPGESGLFGRPTTVNNVETLACVPGIVRRGPEWFRSLGTRGGVGTMLFTLDDRVERPGVHEMPMGATFRELLYEAGGGPVDKRPLRALLPATSSRFLPASRLDLPMTHEDVKAAGSSLGCGGLSFLLEGECVVERAAALAGFFKREQCGQCPACRMETSTLAAVLEQVRRGEAGDYASQIEKIVAFAAGKGHCSLIPMAAAPVVSALELFPEDFAHHASRGRCPGAPAPPR